MPPNDLWKFDKHASFPQNRRFSGAASSSLEPLRSYVSAAISTCPAGRQLFSAWSQRPRRPSRPLPADPPDHSSFRSSGPATPESPRSLLQLGAALYAAPVETWAPVVTFLCRLGPLRLCTRTNPSAPERLPIRADLVELES